MREMIYTPNRKAEILHRGEYKGYKYCIMSLGTHPTAYVENKLEKCNDYGDKRLDDISVHCGFTYHGRAYWDEADKTIYLGWDYAHYCDYAGYYSNFPCDTSNGKRWTTAEIYDEVKEVIDQFVPLSNEKGGEG